MSSGKVSDLAFGRLQSPSLDQAEEFLTNFGLHRAERTKDALYMRGTDPNHHLHVTHLGPSKFIGLSFLVDNIDELKKFTKISGATGIEHVDEPGGGQRVRLTDPLGYQLELICGMQQLDPLPVRKAILNTGDNKYNRAGKLMRLPAGPSHVKRAAHAVLMTPNANSKIQWYRDVLGLVCSDEVYAGSKDNIIASFNRVDKGETYVDHHIFLLIDGPTTGLNHLSFEAQDIDDIMLGHQHLVKANKYEHVWGIGRHVLGSQVYDYWKDPWGRVHEHWTDSDVLNNSYTTQSHAAEDGLNSQWGEAVPHAFITHAIP